MIFSYLLNMPQKYFLSNFYKCMTPKEQHKACINKNKLKFQLLNWVKLKHALTFKTVLAVIVEPKFPTVK